ncbi:MAG: dienelactone hydrolase family protein [Rhodothermaceae bacterium]|nr:dienelactone hydrolase family protein [Rhodothermaceae bacterium]
MRPLLALLILPLLLVACSPSDADGDYADRMATEHADETPTATATTHGADSLDVRTEDVVYATVNGEAVTGYLARPTDADGPLPAIIVIQEWWGLNDNIRAMARQFAAQGYTALAVDLYSGQVATTPDEAMSYMQAAMEEEAALTENVRQAYAYLTTEQQAPRVGSVGWCFGGGWSLRTALALPDDLDAAVIYYGQVVTDRDRLATLNVPLLGLFGADDQGIPIHQVQDFESTLQDLGKDATVQIYEGANHAFANPSGERYNAEAAEDAWARTTAFFAEHLK